VAGSVFCSTDPTTGAQLRYLAGPADAGAARTPVFPGYPGQGYESKMHMRCFFIKVNSGIDDIFLTIFLFKEF